MRLRLNISLLHDSVWIHLQTARWTLNSDAEGAEDVMLSWPYMASAMKRFVAISLQPMHLIDIVSR